MKYNVCIYNHESVLIANHSCRKFSEAQRTADKYNSMQGVYAEVHENVCYS